MLVSQISEPREVVAVEIVAGVDPQARRRRGLCRAPEAVDPLLLCVRAPGPGVGARVQLHPVHAGLGCQRHLLGLAVHEDAHADALGAEAGGHGGVSGS